jgi:metal-responsive CopG/Arc/MetJ family transcriptional regulator
MESKVKVGFSIDHSTNEEFNNYCEAGSINKSKLVNKILKDFLKNRKKEIDYV